MVAIQNSYQYNVVAKNGWYHIMIPTKKRERRTPKCLKYGSSPRSQDRARRRCRLQLTAECLPTPLISSTPMLERKIEALNNKMLALVNESVSSGDGIEAHESEFMTLSQETELLKQRIAAIQESTAKDNGEQNRLEQIQAIIAERESKCMEYDDSIVRQMVECIKVYPGGKLEIIFGGGYLVEESV